MMTWICSVGSDLAGPASSTRARRAGAGAGDVGVEVPIAEIERAGSGIDVLRDAHAPDPHLRIGHAVDGSEVLERRGANGVRGATGATDSAAGRRRVPAKLRPTDSAPQSVAMPYSP